MGLRWSAYLQKDVTSTHFNAVVYLHAPPSVGLYTVDAISLTGDGPLLAGLFGFNVDLLTVDQSGVHDGGPLVRNILSEELISLSVSPPIACSATTRLKATLNITYQSAATRALFIMGGEFWPDQASVVPWSFDPADTDQPVGFAFTTTP